MKLFAETCDSLPVSQVLLSLLLELPDGNSDMLRLFMAHMCRVCLQSSSDIGVCCEELARLFVNVIIRPPWERIV